MKRIIKQRNVIIPFCEGESEIKIFSFLKLEYSNRKIEFRKPKDINGFDNFLNFKRKYNKLCKEQGFKSNKFPNVKFLFIFDNDLGESEKIKKFLLKEGHLVQQSEPNIEGLLLCMVGKHQGDNLKTKDFRKKCKDNFEKHFKCSVPHIEGKKLKNIFDCEKKLKDNFPTLHDLFTS